MRQKNRITIDGVDESAPSVPPKQVIMYYAKDDDPDRLYTIAYIEDTTVDRIAKRVVEMLDQRRSKVVNITNTTGRKRKGKKS